MKRITQRDIADKTGFSRPSVSAALNHNPRMNKATAAFIRKTAKEMGYRPDPVFVEMGRNRWRRAQTSTGENLVFLTDVELNTVREKHLINLVEHASQKGYRLERRLVSEFANVQQADREFRARGVRGIMSFIRLQESDKFLEKLQTEYISVVSEESDLAIFHNISRNWAEILWVLVHKMIDSGYKRISILLFKNEPLRFFDRQRIGAINTLQEKFPGKIHFHTIKTSLNSNSDAAVLVNIEEDEAKQILALKEILATDQPDAVIGWSDGEYHLLKNLGVKIPAELGFASLVSRGECSGMDASMEELWKAQLGKLVSQIRRADFGHPTHPLMTLFTPDFIDAGTF